LDWKGAEFFALYAVVALTAFVLAMIVRLVFSHDEPAPNLNQQTPLIPYESACLAAGPARSVQAAFAALGQAGCLRLGDAEEKVFGIFTQTNTTIQQGKPLPASAPRLEQALYSAAVIPAENLAPLTTAGLPIAQDIEESLRKRGLLQPLAPPASCIVASLIIAAPPLLGLG